MTAPVERIAHIDLDYLKMGITDTEYTFDSPRQTREYTTGETEVTYRGQTAPALVIRGLVELGRHHDIVPRLTPGLTSLRGTDVTIVFLPLDYATAPNQRQLAEYTVGPVNLKYRSMYGLAPQILEWSVRLSWVRDLPPEIIEPIDDGGSVTVDTGGDGQTNTGTGTVDG